MKYQSTTLTSNATLILLGRSAPMQRKTQQERVWSFKYVVIMININMPITTRSIH